MLVRLAHLLEVLVLRGIPAVVEREPRRDQRAAGAQAKVHRRGGVDRVRLADLPEDPQRRRRRLRQLACLRPPPRILELRQDERIDPLRVGRPLDALRQLRPNDSSAPAPPMTISGTISDQNVSRISPGTMIRMNPIPMPMAARIEATATVPTNGSAALSVALRSMSTVPSRTSCTALTSVKNPA